MRGNETPRKRPTTIEWASARGISTALTLPPIAGYDDRCPFTARQIAIRTVILQGVVAVASEVDPEPVIEWFHEQEVWDLVSPEEQSFLLNRAAFPQKKWQRLRWRQESEWTLLWVVGKIDALGLPTHQCDTRRLVDEIIPALGTEIEPFLMSAQLRPPGVLLGEDDRHYDLYCSYFQTRRRGIHLLPSDLDIDVLHQRQYAFEWLHVIEAWDNVQRDA